MTPCLAKIKGKMIQVCTLQAIRMREGFKEDAAEAGELIQCGLNELTVVNIPSPDFLLIIWMTPMTVPLMRMGIQRMDLVL